MTLRDGVLAVRDNDFLNLQIEGDSKIVIDYFNRKLAHLVQLFY